ncbi:MAG: hypothetical protein K7J46_18765 [Bryobacter sp.]|nr:hypothetical protein [Bryobacter sp. CoA8 C33]
MTERLPQHRVDLLNLPSSQSHLSETYLYFLPIRPTQPANWSLFASWMPGGVKINSQVFYFPADHSLRRTKEMTSETTVESLDRIRFQIDLLNMCSAPIELTGPSVMQGQAMQKEAVRVVAELKKTVESLQHVR